MEEQQSLVVFCVILLERTQVGPGGFLEDFLGFFDEGKSVLEVFHFKNSNYKRMQKLSEIRSQIGPEKGLSLGQPVSLEGKVAVISGATRGIGYEIAKRLAREKCNIVVLGKTT